LILTCHRDFQLTVRHAALLLSQTRCHHLKWVRLVMKKAHSQWRFCWKILRGYECLRIPEARTAQKCQRQTQLQADLTSCAVLHIAPFLQQGKRVTRSKPANSDKSTQSDRCPEVSYTQIMHLAEKSDDHAEPIRLSCGALCACHRPYHLPHLPAPIFPHRVMMRTTQEL
jgi:hypothetical protein